MKTLSAPQILPLTGLRFLAALIVVAFHFAKPESAVLANFVGHGFIGVTLFFVLSGFILSYTYVDAQGRMKGTRKAFWAARFARIYPAYVVGFLMMIPSVLVWGHGSRVEQVSTAFSALVLLQSWLHDAMPGVWNIWNPPGWSLSAEAFFYLTFPFVCIPLSRLSMSRLLGLMVICWVLSCAASAAFITTGSADQNFWIYDPLYRLPEFVLGVAAGILWKRRTTSVFDRASTYTAPLSLAALGALMCTPFSNEYFYNGATSPLMLMLICSLASNRGLVAAFLSWRPMVVLGGASYSLYILHWPLWIIFNYLISKLHIEFISTGVQFFIYLLLAIFTSYICFKFIEEPANQFLRRRLIRPVATSKISTSDVANRSGSFEVS